MKISLLFNGSETIELDVESSDTVGDIKQKVAKKKGYIPIFLYAIVNRKWVPEDTILSDLKVDATTEITLHEKNSSCIFTGISFESKLKLK